MASSCVYMSAMILLQETDFLSLSPSPCQKHNIFGDEVPMEKHGHITEFDPGQDDWSSYVESLEHYLAANDVLDANKKRSILLSTCGAATYRVIRNLLLPRTSTDASFTEIVQLIKGHYDPKPSVIVNKDINLTLVFISQESQLQHL